MPPLVAIGIALVAAALWARGVRGLAGRLRESFEELRTVEPHEGHGATYRSQRVGELDRGAPMALAIAAQAQGWLVVTGLVRLGTLPMEIIDLLDEPHRRLGLVPPDDGLVVAHGALGVAVIAASVGALLARWSIVRLARTSPSRRELGRRPLLALGASLSAIAAITAGATSAAVIVRTPMSLYWLVEITGQSAIYALSAALVTTATVRAIRATRRWRVAVV